jgi:hypothetical protein
MEFTPHQGFISMKIGIPVNFSPNGEILRRRQRPNSNKAYFSTLYIYTDVEVASMLTIFYILFFYHIIPSGKGYRNKPAHKLKHWGPTTFDPIFKCLNKFDVKAY